MPVVTSSRGFFYHASSPQPKTIQPTLNYSKEMQQQKMLELSHLLIVFDLFSADQVIDSSVTAAALMHFM